MGPQPVVVAADVDDVAVVRQTVDQGRRHDLVPGAAREGSALAEPEQALPPPAGLAKAVRSGAHAELRVPPGRYRERRAAHFLHQAGEVPQAPPTRVD